MTDIFVPPPGKALFPFQEEDVAKAYLTLVEGGGAVELQHSMGLGKTAMAIAVSSLMFEDDLIDKVLVVAEANKVRDWAEDDFPSWSQGLSVMRYQGTPTRRKNIREKHDPDVLVMTYETGRNDIAVFEKATRKEGRAIKGPGPLAEWVAGKRLLIVFDEVTKLRNRTNRLHLSWNFLVNSYLVKKSWKVNGPKPYLMGLTGTKIESRPEDHYNVNRILASDVSPTVEQFENAYVAEWDKWSDTPSAWKNLSDATTEPGVVSLASLYSHMTIRRRKQDPEVINWFPKKVENPSRYIQMSKAQEDFYWAVVEALEEDNPLAGMSALRQIANAPAALLRSQGELAKAIVEIVGSNTLRQMGSAKTDAMVNWAYEADDQQMVIFTFYGQSVLPVLHDRLREEGYSVSINHGQMTGKARQDSQNAYKAGETQIFLTSDAGARGLNLGVGSALLHYELPPLAAIYHQRSDRIHRADSTHPSVTVDSLITADTVDDLIVNMMLRRDGWQDAIVDNDQHSSEATEAGYLSAQDRRDLWAAARKKPVAGR